MLVNRVQFALAHHYRRSLFNVHVDLVWRAVLLAQSLQARLTVIARRVYLEWVSLCYQVFLASLHGSLQRRSVAPIVFWWSFWLKFDLFGLQKHPLCLVCAFILG